jgi:pyruvate dehydrogenase E2 component (dihydrolipoamide acetyltransferase)
MPRLSDSMSEATIVAWLKKPGESFLRGEPLVAVETDKATVDYEAEADGLLAEILVPEGEIAALGAPIARLGGEDAESAPAATNDAAQTAAETVRPVAVASAPNPKQPARGGRPRATPVARQTSAFLGVPLHGLTGTGPSGRIRKLDVLRARSSVGSMAEHGDLKGPTTVVALSTTGKTIARRMLQSRSEIPSFDVVMDADMATIVELRRGAAELVDARPSVNDFVIKAVALALRDFPAFNGSFVDGRVERHGRVNVGFAVATEDALLVPTVVDADLKSLAVIADETRDLAGPRPLMQERNL